MVSRIGDDSSIGSVYAKKLLRVFGENVFDVIETEHVCVRKAQARYVKFAQHPQSTIPDRHDFVH